MYATLIDSEAVFLSLPEMCPLFMHGATEHWFNSHLSFGRSG